MKERVELIPCTDSHDLKARINNFLCSSKGKLIDIKYVGDIEGYTALIIYLPKESEND